ncbi:MAG: acyltransferase domain-containing protein [Hydrogenophaga sp.]|uniref:acyltransferase domain-containing protein n=1 Tax=Hydrogenophaga sp. TaxID=1904254 RepID=UPI0025C05F3A|nr:acyltransferase domain-containing protein [Hydrogenophaga sp.]MBT9549719.1 acyltransferase domain-containing protein [Hydrogenophaga sp.]
MTLALVFPGQGMQHPDMLPWLDADDPLLVSAASRLDVHDWRRSLADPAWATDNRHAQHLLSACGIAAWQQLRPSLPRPVAVAGYSVGEIAAHTVAGVMSPTVALDFADVRSRAMDACGADERGALLGVTGLLLAPVQAVCEREGVFVAIHNGTDSVVLGGTARRIEAAEDALSRLGAKCTRLNVAVASHTPLMREASVVVRSWLTGQGLQRPDLALLANLTATRVRSAQDACDALSGQISHTVQWSGCMDAIHAQGPRCVLELGPGQSLASLWNRRFADVPARSADEFRSVGALVRWVLSHQD